MKKVTKLISIAFALGTILSLSSCKNGGLDENKTSDALPFVRQTYFDFTKKQPLSGFSISDGYSNNNPFGSTWSKDLVTYSKNEGLKLGIAMTDDEKKIKSDSGDPFISGEVRTASSFKYGFFGTYMKPSKVQGTASTFFTYTGASEGNPHDEIDIEFLGKDTTKVQFNFFVDDVGNHEYWYDLGFDASEAYHYYGFYWGKNEITWYVDDTPVYRLTGDESKIPSHPCRLFANSWTGTSNDSGIIGWMGRTRAEDFSSPVYSIYKKFYIADELGNAISKLPVGDDYPVNPAEVELTPFNTTLTSVSTNSYSRPAYTVVEGTNEYEISYTKESITKNYLCVKLGVENIKDLDLVEVKIQNLENHPLLARLTVNSVMPDGTNNPNILRSIWKNGETSLECKISNSTEGIMELKANETATLRVKWYGVCACELTFMFDDFGDCPVVADPNDPSKNIGQRDGHCKLSGIKFGGVQEADEEDKLSEVEELYVSEDKESERGVVPAGYVESSCTFVSGSGYTAKSGADGLDVTYDITNDGGNYTAIPVSGNDFQNVTKIILEVRNNDIKDEYFRVKCKDTAGNGCLAGLDVISNYKTGRYDRVSGSTGDIYFYISAGRSCMVELTLKGKTTVKSFGLIAGVAKVHAVGNITLRGIYKLVGE